MSPSSWSPSTTLPAAVHGDQPVGVAVEGEPEVGASAAHLCRQRRRRGGAAADVDVHAVGLVVDHVDPGAGCAEDAGPPRRPGPVRAVEDDVQARSALPVRQPTRWAR